MKKKMPKKELPLRSCKTHRSTNVRRGKVAFAQQTQHVPKHPAPPLRRIQSHSVRDYHKKLALAESRQWSMTIWDAPSRFTKGCASWDGAMIPVDAANQRWAARCSCVNPGWTVYIPGFEVSEEAGQHALLCVDWRMK